MQKIEIDKSLLEKLYLEDEMTLQQIADKLSVSRQTVANKLGEFTITIRNSEYKRNKRNIKPKLKRVIPYKKKEVFETAYKKLKSIGLVADYFGINRKTAYEWKKRHNIETIKEYSDIAISKMHKDKPYTDEKWLRDMCSKHSFKDIANYIGCDSSTIGNWAKKFNIKALTHSEQWDLKSKNGIHFKNIKDLDLLIYNGDINFEEVTHLHKGFKKLIISLYKKCESCGYDEVLDLHHIDGNHKNNKPENHSVLCPNCHAKIHRLHIPFKDLVPKHKNWYDIMRKRNSYADAK